MGKVRWKWHMKGYRQVRTSPGVVADVQSRAAAIALAAGEGMEADFGITGGRVRARASVRTATHEARAAEASDRALTRSIDAGR